MEFSGIENELVVLTKQTINLFLQSDYPTEVMALYLFYYYTAKWQETNQPRCTTKYVATGLKWGEQKVRKIKKELMSLGLIEDVQEKDEEGKISGHYVKLNYLFKQSTLEENHPYKNPQCGVNHSVDESTVWNEPQCGTNHSVDFNTPNALSDNKLNALSDNKRNALSDNREIYTAVVDHLNAKTGKHYKSSNDTTRRYIRARLNDGFTVEDFKSVINKKTEEWLNTDMEKYLRPETLFGTKFESYLNEKIKKKSSSYDIGKVKERARKPIVYTPREESI